MTLRDLMSWERPFGVTVNKGAVQPGIPSYAVLQAEMNRLFDYFYKGQGQGHDLYLNEWEKEMSTMLPAVNIIEKGDAFILAAELPGISPEDVEVSVTSGYLTIKGEKAEEKEEKGGSYIRLESTGGSFYRQIGLPETANFDKAEATFKNGILTVTVPKKAEAVQHPKKLQIKKAA